MAQPSTTPEQQRAAKYAHDQKCARELDAKFAHQHKLSEMPDSNGSHTSETDIIEAMNSTSTGNDFGNSYWFGVLVVLIFLGAIFLTNSCSGF